MGYDEFDVPCCCWQCKNAFPFMPWGQVHIGICKNTWQTALGAHVPGHGSRHLLFMQALSLAQSELRTHSGRQTAYGSPWYSGKQLQMPSRHCAFDPHGDGLQRSLAGMSCGRGVNWQLLNGSPLKPSKHIQIGVCAFTIQWAFRPQDPGHGSWHFWRMQAWLLAHSWFMEHSGLQFGG